MKKNLFKTPSLYLGISALFLFSCCDNPATPEPIPEPKRNILFYIVDDNNNLNEANDKINLIRRGWQSGKGEMLIYIDQYNNACLLRINEKKDAYGYSGLDTIQIYGSENSADPATLSRVINTMTHDYPADSYGMLFFSHGSGWMPEGMLSKPRSLVIDGGETPKREMEYYGFAGAIPDGQFDFIIFEACLMSDILSMYELRNKADYLLASSAEIVSPGFTYIYEKEIMRLYDVKSDVQQVVTGFAESYCSLLTTTYSANDWRCSFTMSITKTSELGNLAAITKTVLQDKAFDETIPNMNDIQYFDRLGANSFGYQRRARYFDLGQTIEHLVADAQFQSFNTQLEKTVVWKSASKNFLLIENGFPINRHSGLTTYIEQSVFPELNAAFENSSWYKAIYQ